MSEESSPTRALQHLEERRHILQRLLATARMIENLKDSMAHMLEQDVAAAEGNERLADFMAALGQQVRNLSDADVQLRLGTLDQKLRALFKKLSPLISWISTADEHGLDDLDPIAAEAEINDLKRTARTALALRGLLARRGVSVPELRLPLDRDRLQQQLRSITGEEQKARRSVIQQVREIGREVRQLLDMPELPDLMRGLLEQMLQGLRDNLAHLKAGHSVQELPLDIDATSFAEGSVSMAPAAPPGTPEAAVSLEPALPGEPDSRPEPEPQPPAAGPAKQPAGPRPGLIRALWIWISSPMEVRWQDIREGRYRR